jgi:hypothetical protein
MMTGQGLTFKSPSVETPIARIPVLPVILLGAGAYLVWFGIHYFEQGGYPTEPVKAVLTGKPLPPSATPAGSTSISPTRTSASVIAATLTAASGTAPATGGTGGGGNAAIAADAQKYVGHTYVLGGPSNPTSGWDCSSFASYVLGHDLGYQIPGGAWATATANGAIHGPVAADYKTWAGATTVAAPVAPAPGMLLCWDTHVGFIASDGKSMISAYDTADGTTIHPDYGTAGPTGEALVIRQVNAAQSSGGGAAASGDERANAKTIYQFLRTSGYSAYAAAGAVASMDGESTLNPESVGSGGCGLMGWNLPATSGSNNITTYGGTCQAAGVGNGTPGGDLGSQLQAILRYVSANGMSGAVTLMNSATSVTSAAYIWQNQVEKPSASSPDVHPHGIAVGVTAASDAENVTLTP